MKTKQKGKNRREGQRLWQNPKNHLNRARLHAKSQIHRFVIQPL